MSVEHHAQLILGAIVQRGQFFTTGGTRLRCKGGHGHPEQGERVFSHCNWCGQVFERVPKEDPTEAFRSCAGKLGKSPEQLWQQWEDAYEPQDVLRLSIPGRSDTFVLGMLLADVTEDQLSCSSVPWSEMEKARGTVKRLLKDLGIEAEIQVLLNLWVL